MGRSDLVEFSNSLVAIKTKNIPAVAARMCRCLRDFPREYEVRTSAVGPTNGPGNLLFDSVWDENIGSLIAKVQGQMTMENAKKTFEALYVLQDFVIHHTEEILGVRTQSAELINDFNYAYEEKYKAGPFNAMLNGGTYKGKAFPPVQFEEDLDTSVYPSKCSYCGLGYIFDQKTLNEDECRIYDLYEFGRWVSTLDITGALWVINRQVTATNWDAIADGTAAVNSLPYMAFCIRKAVDDVTKMVCYACEQIAAICHKVDGIAALSDPKYLANTEFLAVPSNISEFDPATNVHWEKLETELPTGWNNNVYKGKSVKQRMAIKLKGNYRLKSVTFDGKDLDYAYTGTVNGYAVFLTDSFFFENANLLYSFDLTNGTTSGSFNKNNVEVYVSNDSN